MAEPTINVDEIIGKIEVPGNLKGIFDRAVLSGMRIMFDRNSHQMLLEQLDKPGPLADKVVEGIISLVFMLWTESNRSLPPQIMVPVTVVLTLRAYEFLAQSGEPEATPALLGEVMSGAVTGILERFGVSEDQLPELARQAQGQPQQPQAPQGGMIQQGGAA